MVKKAVPYFLIVLLSFFALKPLFSQGYFPMHDDTQPTRVYLMTQALSNGQFPVRWVDELGYGFGYPLFNFYAPLPYYIGAAIHLVGVDIITSTKAMMALGFVISSLSMLMLGKKIWGLSGGLVAATLYMYAPYHAVQLYVRGAVGELWAYAFIPVVFVGFLCAKGKRVLIGILIGAIGLAGVILSHNIISLFLLILMAMWFLVEVIMYMRTKQSNTIIFLGSSLILALTLTSFFWLPAIAESQLTQVEKLAGGTNHFSHHFLTLSQLWDSPWGYAGSAPGLADGISFKIGKLHLLLATLGLVSFARKKKKNTVDSRIMWLSIIGFLVVSFMMLGVSDAIWRALPLLIYAQYPWRLLVFAHFFLALLSGYVFLHEFIKKVKPSYLAALILFITIAVNYKYFQPQYIYSVSNGDYVSKENIVWKISKISDEYLPKNFPIPQNELDVASQKIVAGDGIIVKSAEIKPHFISLAVKANQSEKMRFAIAHFPGWKAVVDTSEVQPETNGRYIEVPLSQGDHAVTVFFGNTPVRSVANFISMVSIITFGALIIYQHNKWHEA